MGEGPAQVLVMAISDDGFRGPAQFIREVEQVFGRDVLPIYSAILKAAKDPDWLHDMHARPAQYEARTGGLAPTVIGRLDQGEKERDFYLHDHRQPDDFSEEDSRY
jgi:hypothetical protein